MGQPASATSHARLRGQVIETGQAVEITAPRKRKRKKGWRDHVSMVDTGLMQQLEMTGGEYRVFYCLLAHVPERGGAEAFVTVDEIAATLGVTRQYVSTILRSLRDRRIVTTLRTGRHHINTWLAYNGDFDSWNAEVEKEPEPIWSRGVDSKTGEMQ